MKTTSLATLCAALGMILPDSARAAETSFIRQIQQFGGVSVSSDIMLSKEVGSTTSNLLASEFSIFQLYTTYTNAESQSVLLKLDEKSIGTFLPKVTIDLVSEDPYVPVTTRADRPYSATVKVSGLLSDPTVPDYAKLVLVGSGYKPYSPASMAATGEAVVNANSWQYRANGNFVDTNVLQSMPGGIMAMGAETYSAYVLPGAGSGQLASAEIIIWPVAVAAIEGIAPTTSGKVYYGMPEDSVVKLFYAYPRSSTYVQIYKGSQKLGTVGTVLPATVRTYTKTVPQDATIPLNGLDGYITQDGEYTLEVLTVTPFNNRMPERLAHVSFVVNRTIKVNSMLTTIE